MKNIQTCRVNVMVRNMDAAVKFYCEVIGLTLLNRYQDHYAEVQAPDLMIGLHPADDGVTFGSNMSIGLGVTNFDSAVAELEAEGIAIEVAKDGWIRLAHFADPDGNRLFLAERTD